MTELLSTAQQQSKRQYYKFIYLIFRITIVDNREKLLARVLAELAAVLMREAFFQQSKGRYFFSTFFFFQHSEKSQPPNQLYSHIYLQRIHHVQQKYEVQMQAFAQHNQPPRKNLDHYSEYVLITELQGKVWIEGKLVIVHFLYTNLNLIVSPKLGFRFSFEAFCPISVFLVFQGLILRALHTSLHTICW